MVKMSQVLLSLLFVVCVIPGCIGSSDSGVFPGKDNGDELSPQPVVVDETIPDEIPEPGNEGGSQNKKLVLIQSLCDWLEASEESGGDFALNKAVDHKNNEYSNSDYQTYEYFAYMKFEGDCRPGFEWIKITWDSTRHRERKKFKQQISGYLYRWEENQSYTISQSGDRMRRSWSLREGTDDKYGTKEWGSAGEATGERIEVLSVESLEKHLAIKFRVFGENKCIDPTCDGSDAPGPFEREIYIVLNKLFSDRVSIYIDGQFANSF